MSVQIKQLREEKDNLHKEFDIEEGELRNRLSEANSKMKEVGNEERAMDVKENEFDYELNKIN